MNVFVLLDGVSGLSDHWVDVAVVALITTVGYLLSRDISAMDKRHDKAEDEFKEVNKQIGDHEVRITVLENDRK